MKEPNNIHENNLPIILSTHLVSIYKKWPAIWLAIQFFVFLDSKISQELFFIIVKEMLAFDEKFTHQAISILSQYVLIHINEASDELIIQPELQQALMEKIPADEKLYYVVALLHVMNFILLCNDALKSELILLHIEKLLLHAQETSLEKDSVLAVFHFNLSIAYQKLDKFSQAIQHQTKVLNILTRRSAQETDLPSVQMLAMNLSQLAQNCRKMNDLDKAYEYSEHAYLLLQKSLGDDAIQTKQAKENFDAIGQECVLHSKTHLAYSYVFKPIHVGYGLYKYATPFQWVKTGLNHLAVPTVGWFGKKTGIYQKESGEYWASWGVEVVAAVADPTGYCVNKGAQWVATKVTKKIVEVAQIKDRNLHALLKISASEIAGIGGAKLTKSINTKVKDARKQIETGAKTIRYSRGQKMVVTDGEEQLEVIKETMTAKGERILKFSSGDKLKVDEYGTKLSLKLQVRKQ